jgi:hypothetical protein
VTVSAATQVKETRRNAERLPRRAGLLSIARGPRRAPRDEMGGRAARASMTFDVFASAAPARSVTRVTHRRPIECPGPRPLAGCCQPAIRFCHRGINALTCVFYKLDRRKGTIIASRHCFRTATSRHGSNTTEDRKKKAPQ